MFTLFEITARQERLIELMSEKDIYLPTKYYANLLNVSERTIFNDITKLKAIFKSFDVKVDKKPNQGIKLCGEISSLGVFYQQLMNKNQAGNDAFFSPLDRQILIAKWLLIEGRTLTYQSLSVELYISSTSIIRDLEHIKLFMGEEISLISDIKGTRVKGSEIGIQRTLKRFAYHVIEQRVHNFSVPTYAKNLVPLFDGAVLRYVKQAMEELVAVLDSSVSEQYLKSLFIFLLIVTERSSKGFHIKEWPKVDWEMEDSLTNFPLAVQICQPITSSLNFEFRDSEIQYISNQLFAHRIEVKLNNKYIENLIAEDIHLIIAEVSSAMGIDLTLDERLYDSLIYHMFPMIYRLKTGIAINNPLMNEIKNNYGILFQMIWYVMENFEKKYDIKLSDNEIAFITIHFQVAIERKVQMREILVVCQTGIVTSDLIMNRIKKLLPANIRFRLIAKPMLKDEDVSKVDFIISSVKLEHLPTPVVYVSPIVRDADLMKIYASYLKYSSAGQGEDIRTVPSRETSGYLDYSYLFLNEELTKKEECLNKMIHLFEKDGIVTSEFKQSVYEREELGNTLVQSWIATPHGQKAAVKQTKIAIMSTKAPIKWNHTSQVSLIILLAVAEQDMSQIRQLLGQLFRNILQSESMEQQVKSFKEPVQLAQLFTV